MYTSRFKFLVKNNFSTFMTLIYVYIYFITRNKLIENVILLSLLEEPVSKIFHVNKEKKTSNYFALKNPEFKF